MRDNEFRRRLAAEVRDRYRGVAVDASRAIGVNDNYISKLLRNPHQMPGLDVLQRMAQEFGWPLHDAVDWVLGLPPGEREVTPEAEARHGLARLGLDPVDVDSLVRLARSLQQRQARSAPPSANNGS